MTALGPRAHRRGTEGGSVTAARADAELERREARRRAAARADGVAAPSRHDLDLVSHWPAWRRAVQDLAADMAAGTFTIIDR